MMHLQLIASKMITKPAFNFDVPISPNFLSLIIPKFDALVRPNFIQTNLVYDKDIGI